MPIQFATIGYVVMNVHEPEEQLQLIVSSQFFHILLAFAEIELELNGPFQPVGPLFQMYNLLAKFY